MNKYLTEVVGTFFLVLTIGLTVLDGTPFAPVAIGAVLVVMVCMGGHVSGAHYNPAVSIALLMRGKIESKELLPYWISEIVGAFLAAGAVKVITGKNFVPAPAADASSLAILLCEILFTFALTLVILNVATAKGTSGNSFYGLAIGFTVMAGVFAVGPISGGVFNPAVSIGPILMKALTGGGSMADLWYYLVGPFGGAIGAALFFEVQNPKG